jgi:ankyrin repeat protein
MKRRRILLLILLAPLIVVSVPMGYFLREWRHEQASRDLIAAIKANNTPAALAALNNGADPNANAYPDQLPSSFSERMKQLLDKILHPNSRSTSGTHITALAYLLEPHPPEGDVICDVDPTETLSLPHPKESPDLLKALLERGANPNTRGEYGFTPLYCAAAFGYNDSVLLLLQHGADVNAKGDTKGRMGTALHAAILHCKLQTVRLLLECGADVDMQGALVGTPLIVATFIKDAAKVQLLLDHHANLNLKTFDGKTALDFATDYEHGHGMKGIDTLLRKAGAKPGTGNIPEHQGPHGLVPK